MLEKIFGWCSFTFWSCVPYPQIYINLKKKNSNGMSVNMIFFSLLQYTCYTLLSYILYFSNTIKNNYQQIMKDNSTDIYLSDIFFSSHALLSTLFLTFQYFYYNHSDNKLTMQSKILLLTLTFIILMQIVFCIILYYIHNDSSYLAYMILSLSISHNIFTLFKYIPQVYYTYKRKSTDGWNIQNVNFDILGGLFLLFESITTAVKKHEIKILFSNIAKLNLILITIIFDITMYIQYFIYPNISINSPKIPLLLH
tara:strand:+ start:166 stop:927 length:762 start_codon:yes stop_codon:yes gene_type:complete